MIRCKMYVEKVTLFSKPPETGAVTLRAVWKSKPGVDGNACEENRVFGQYTPTASFDATILNPQAFATFVDVFKRGASFYVDLTEAPE